MGLFLKVWLVFLLVGSIACGHSPVDLATASGSYLGVLNKISVSRQRQLLIPAESHLGLAVSVVADSVTEDTEKDIKALLTRAGQAQLLRSFAQVTVLDEGVKAGQVVPATVDFLLHINLLTAKLGTLNQTQQPPGLEPAVIADEGELKTMASTPIQHQAIIQLLLTDARSGKVIDTVFIRSRAGVFTYRVENFFEQSVAAYLKKITVGPRYMTY